MKVQAPIKRRRVAVKRLEVVGHHHHRERFLLMIN
jgi:hypothetical protein